MSESATRAAAILDELNLHVHGGRFLRPYEKHHPVPLAVIEDALQQARAAGLREALEYAAHCAIERNGAANDLPKGDQRRTWVECKESEAVRIRDWCQRRLKQIEARAGEGV